MNARILGGESRDMAATLRPVVLFLRRQAQARR